MKCKRSIFLLCLGAIFCLNGPSHAQWIVADPGNLAQGIINATKNITQTSSTAANMIKNFEETVKIYEQGKAYYDALKKVKDLVRDARKVQQTILMMGDITDIYVNSFQKMLSDPSFSAEELSAIAKGYTVLLEESAFVINDLKPIVNNSGLSMTDKERMDAIDQCYEEDTEKEVLREEVERLKAAMEERQQVSSSYDDQVALLEKSYELAAKYMPGGKEGGNSTGKAGAESGGTSEKKTDVSPVSHATKAVVSSLYQIVSDSEFVRQFGQPKNYAFHTATSEEVSKEKNTICAVVHEDQTLVNGQSVRLRITEPVRTGGQLIPRNTILTGVGRILGERMEIRVSSIEYEGSIIPVSLQAYDADGQQGVYIPGSMEMTAIKEIAGNLGQNLGGTINISQQDAGEQLLTDLGRGAIQGASQYISKKTREVKVTLKAGYRIFLLPGESNN
jgi:conjugative transposon TraM protein